MKNPFSFSSRLSQTYPPPIQSGVKARSEGTTSKEFSEPTKCFGLPLQKLIRPILPFLNQVEDRLKAIANESNGILKESSSYVLSAGGKRLRASLVILCALSTSQGFKRKKAVIDAAVSVELIHAATLVHDDIIDHSVLRRLKPTPNIQFGEEVALLLGDYLYSKAFHLVSTVGDNQLTLEVARTTQSMCEGELDQLKHRYRSDLSLNEYLSFIERKTASLISVCARAGARLAGLPKELEESLANFGLNIGISYQIVDDLLDVIGSEKKCGKSLKNDTGNGKMTLPLILLLASMNENEKKKLRSDFQTTKINWEMIDPLLKEKKIIEQTKNFADDFFAKAMSSLEIFEPSFKKSLQDLSHFIIHRDY
ncbi:MAG: polyprenyl synthetase family protein [Elusimicrobia bacterium]|nr:polyprenyl synthetase family protein [Elusimicrobiota bacterium]